MTPGLRAWFGTMIRNLAIRHDVAGPDIGRVSEDDYKAQLIADLESLARAASDAKELVIAAEEVDVYCCLAAEELIRIRQIRAAHKAGELPAEVLRQLPVYPAFRDYFDESPQFVLDQLIAAARDLWRAMKKDAATEPLAQPGHPTHPVSKPTRNWMEMQALGLACADDAWGAPFGAVPQEVYVPDSALRIRENARRALRIGDLHVPPEDVDKICWVAACEAYLLRSLKAAKQSGELTDAQIRKMPIYAPYKDYFEIGSDLAAATEAIAAAMGRPIQPLGAQN